MLFQPTISGTPATDIGLDQARLYAEGMDHIRSLSGAVWTDHNIHDPGITTLELFCYAATELTYRAMFPLEDLLATKANNAANMAEQFFTPRQVLHNRPWTVLDYRKLLIDLPEVRNAWLRSSKVQYVADSIHGKLRRTDASVAVQPWERIVELRGVYDAHIAWQETATEVQKTAAREQILGILHRNRNLGEDFVEVKDIENVEYSICAEIELKPDADLVAVESQLRFEVEQYLAPPIRRYTLAEMLNKTHDDGSPYTVPDIFEGPVLTHGFIDDYELADAELRTEIRLSDVINIIMAIPDVVAVRDIVINELVNGKPVAPADKWLLQVPAGKQPILSKKTPGRLVYTKRRLPMRADATQVDAALSLLRAAAQKLTHDTASADIPIPLGRYRNVDQYLSFQNHFPVVYGLSDVGLPSTADARRRAQALQLKGYLLFFDQVMANYFSQLSNVATLFSHKADQTSTYFAQMVKDLKETKTGFQKIYNATVTDTTLRETVESAETALERRNRFLDHLLARFSEDFHDYVRFMDTGNSAETQKRAIAAKCAFLNDLAEQKKGSDRGRAYDHSLQEASALWETANVSGLERRLARLLGIENINRRDLSGNVTEVSEGMFLIENILLRPSATDDPFLPICVNPTCTDCFDDDPYSYRLHIVLPAYAGRFVKMEFRQFVEETIRTEAPAHLMPKVCWVDDASMKKIEVAYHAWLNVRAGQPVESGQQPLSNLLTALRDATNIYPPKNLHDCGGGDTKPPFLLDRDTLGGQKP